MAGFVTQATPLPPSPAVIVASESTGARPFVRHLHTDFLEAM